MSLVAVGFSFTDTKVGDDSVFSFCKIPSTGAYMERTSLKDMMAGSGVAHPTVPCMITSNGNHFIADGEVTVEWRLDDENNNDDTLNDFRNHMLTRYPWANLMFTGPVDGILRMESTTLSNSYFSTFQPLPFQDYS